MEGIEYRVKKLCVKGKYTHINNNLPLTGLHVKSRVEGDSLLARGTEVVSILYDDPERRVRGNNAYV